MDALYDEVESLEAILMEDVAIKRNAESGIPEIIETTIFPLVGEDGNQQYVCVTLQVYPTEEYPNKSPDFKLIKPRGLDDSSIDKIKTACKLKLEDSVGYPVVFDLIEVVREHLTNSNLPSGQCVVCLYGFRDGDEFTRTDCYHYLHSYCLNRHINALRKNYNEEFEKLPSWLKMTAEPFQALCPVCREAIKDDTDCLKCAMPPTELQNAPEFVLTQELRELQLRMSKLFLEQKSRGSIIDVEAENSTVISIESEDEVRERLQKKQADCLGSGTNENITNEKTFKDLLSSENIPGPSSSNDPKTSKIQGNVCFTPVVEPTQTRNLPEPTNNNYNHFRRHRGGRREHHRHYRQRYERERERHKDNNDEIDVTTSNLVPSSNVPSPTTSSNCKPKPSSQMGFNYR